MGLTSIDGALLMVKLLKKRVGRGIGGKKKSQSTFDWVRTTERRNEARVG